MAIKGQWRNAVVLALLTVLAACASQAKKGGGSTTDSAAISAAVDSPDRPNADRVLDAARKPREMLAFFGIRPGTTP
jgi:predicted methyltransferase